MALMSPGLGLIASLRGIIGNVRSGPQWRFLHQLMWILVVSDIHLPS